jgi:uncharacterized membrane protein SirB2
VLEFAESLQSSPLSVAIQSTTWVTPLLQSIHIWVIGIVFVSILMLALRVWGRVRMDETFSDVWTRFAPWLWGGLIVMALTGVVLVIAEPVREFTALSFWLKMALLVIGVTSGVWFGRSLKSAAIAAPAPEFSAGRKAAAAATVVLWLAIIFLGRAIAYDVEVWGSLSLVAGG